MELSRIRKFRNGRDSIFVNSEMNGFSLLKLYGIFSKRKFRNIWDFLFVNSEMYGIFSS